MASFTSLHLQWLLEGTPGVQAILAGEADQEGVPLRIPPELGSGHFDLIHLPFESSLFRGVHRFLPAASGQLVPLGDLTIDYGEPVFLVQTVRGGRICHEESIPPVTLLYEDGRDLFCHSRARRLVPKVDGSTDSDMVSLCIRIQSLVALLGDREARALLEALGIPEAPALAVRAMPKALAALLHAALAKPLLGSARRLFAQAKALEYLSALWDHLRLGLAPPSSPGDPRKAVRALREHLLGLEGKIPALETLAWQFGLPARRLNAAFAQEYGESICAFIAGHRLDEAREALLREDVPMKVLSERLGYSHVNHFINAFRRRFGQPPGSLRRAARKG